MMFYFIIPIGLLYIWGTLRSSKLNVIKTYIGIVNHVEDKHFLTRVIDIIPKVFIVNNDTISAKMEDAGFFDFKYAHFYTPVKFITMTLGCLFIYLGTKAANMELNIPISLSFWVIVTLLVPDALLNMKIKKYRTEIINTLPTFVDLLAVCIKSGMTIDNSMKYLSTEFYRISPKTTTLLKRFTYNANLIGFDNALDNLYKSVPTIEMRSLIMTLRQGTKNGGSIYPMLINLSTNFREIRILDTEEKIGKLSAKMSIPLILFIMMPVVILIVAPGVMRMFDRV